VAILYHGKLKASAAFPVGDMEHHAYSPDPGPSNYHLLPALKEHLGGHRFKSDDNMETVAKQWLSKKDINFHQQKIEKLTPLYNKCFSFCGNYFRK
jgi:hypothetical protein